MVIALSIVAGLASASIYILIALSFNILLAASGVFNFVQASIIMSGTILAYWMTVAWDLPLLACLAAALAVGGLAGAVTEFAAVTPIARRATDKVEIVLLTTLGISLAVDAVVALLFGADPRHVPSYVSEDPISIAGLPVRPLYLLMIAISLVTVGVLMTVVARTSLGRTFRITLEDPDGAALLGINVRRVVRWAFVMAGALAGMAGVLIAPIASASAFTSLPFVFASFAAMAIGGFGSVTGTLVGGGLVGLISGLSAGLLQPAWTGPVLLAILVVVLLLKPAGLLGAPGLFGAARSREV
ncbi:branched-chain amino acid ABC transporter permease [Pseudonocardia dioxanivorans]|jgi:branched-subunit amino acid ABC-type transport system permease component|uniref:branched-chain amino acid ABC transporter permease n=1 Tax=Pseudonocardia dioxanivorans TaxID=240495 RepID=UPI000CD12549|nr:branched-chain amino acid ABC transporter permease [Pseudonocardia dioxanivorans]